MVQLDVAASFDEEQHKYLHICQQLLDCGIAEPRSPDAIYLVVALVLEKQLAWRAEHFMCAIGFGEP